MKKTLTALLLIVGLSIGATAQDAVLSALTDIKTDIAGMRKDIAGMRKDITGMRKDITGMKKDIAGMKKDIAVINARFGRRSKA